MKRTAVAFLTMLLMLFGAALAEDPALDAARALIGQEPRLTERETEHGYVSLEFQEGTTGYEVVCKDGVVLVLETEYQAVRLGEMRLTQEEAEARLLEQRPDAVISYSHSEQDDGRWLWKVFYTLGEDACVAALDAAEGNLREEIRLLGAAAQVMPAKEFVSLMAQQPGALVRKLDLKLDEDAGRIIYEGEARLNAVDAGKRPEDAEQYEFEADAITGELTEWKRD